MPTKIVQIAHYLPPNTLDNEQLAAEFPDTSAEQIFKLSGVKKRHISAPDHIPSDLAVRAAEKLFEQNSAYREQIDALLFCCEGYDYKAPTTACLLNDRLGLKPQCLSLDIPGGCTGFVNGLQVAKGLLSGNGIRTALLLTAETPSKVVHDDDLNLRMLFGDGACATLITTSKQEHIGKFRFGTDGANAKALWIKHSAGRDPATTDWLEEHQHTSNGMRFGQLTMQGEQLLYFALKRVPQLIDDTLNANGLTRDDIRFFVFHQASKIILRTLKRKCRIPDDKFPLHLAEQGNTVSSTIPLTLEHLITTQQAKPGDKILLAGFGIGLSWNATVITI